MARDRGKDLEREVTSALRRIDEPGAFLFVSDADRRCCVFRRHGEETRVTKRVSQGAVRAMLDRGMLHLLGRTDETAKFTLSREGKAQLRWRVKQQAKRRSTERALAS